MIEQNSSQINSSFTDYTSDLVKAALKFSLNQESKRGSISRGMIQNYSPPLHTLSRAAQHLRMSVQDLSNQKITIDDSMDNNS